MQLPLCSPELKHLMGVTASTPVWHDVNISQFTDPVELAPVLKVLKVRPISTFIHLLAMT